MKTIGCLTLTLAAAAVLRGADIGPRLADSAAAQRSRDLTLLGGLPAASPAEVARVKARVLQADSAAARARIAAIDVRLARLPEGDPRAAQLESERRTERARAEEAAEKLRQAEAEVRAR